MVPARDHEGVAGGNGVLVPKGQDEVFLVDEPVRIRAAEGAGRCVGHAGVPRVREVALGGRWEEGRGIWG